MNIEDIDRLDEIPGWFHRPDRLLFDWFLTDEEANGVVGDLAEIGVYQGRSAVLIGSHLRPGETFTVCDVFEGEVTDAANASENQDSYAGLARTRFEDNYRRWRGALPRVLHLDSARILDHVTPGAFRFVHIDGSHLYEQVRVDIGNVRQMVAPGAVVVFDDYRSTHTPGAAAAAWEAVLRDGFLPLCVSEDKMYGTWDAESFAAVQARLLAWLSGHDYLHHEVQQVAGRPLVRVWRLHLAAAQSPLRRWVPPAAVDAAARVRRRRA